MAGSVNKAIIIGRLGRDPEVRTFPSGDRAVSFSVATDESWRDKSTGERKTKTEWHNVTVFNDALGKIAEQYLRKGSQVYLEGQIQTREYQDRDGVQRKVTEIVIPRFGGALTLLDGKEKDSGERTSSSTPARREQAAEPTRGSSLATQLDDDIPFSPEWR